MTESVFIQIPAELFALAESSHFEGEVTLDSLVLGPDTYTFSTPVSWEVEITNTGAAFLVLGTARAEVVCPCSRCLEDVTMQLEGAIEGYFLQSEDAASPQDEDDDAPGADEFELLPADHKIDLLPLIKAALMIEMPVQPLCSDDCAGMCPVCGVNLNHESCACKALSENAIDESNPFSKLANYRFADN